MKRPHQESVLSRAARILEAFNQEQPALTVSEIARRTGLHVATASGLVGELVAHGFLGRDDDGRVRIGARPPASSSILTEQAAGWGAYRSATTAALRFLPAALRRHRQDLGTRRRRLSPGRHALLSSRSHRVVGVGESAPGAGCRAG
ncbi:helix-turn-helix domain-containing protein [Streptomyces sp. NPDC005930]|uniref:helix-turn-helix domain-containing protein n=1 Tax=Streptomyces sp. NPDC005930 TaxID=3364736 RepID=UPI0036930DF5